MKQNKGVLWVPFFCFLSACAPAGSNAPAAQSPAAASGLGSVTPTTDLACSSESAGVFCTGSNIGSGTIQLNVGRQVLSPSAPWDWAVVSPGTSPYVATAPTDLSGACVFAQINEAGPVVNSPAICGVLIDFDNLTIIPNSVYVF